MVSYPVPSQCSVGVGWYGSLIIYRFIYSICYSYCAMDLEEKSYKPEAGFEEDIREPLVDLSLTDSTELWLIQWPHNEVSSHLYALEPPSVCVSQTFRFRVSLLTLVLQLPDFQGKEISISLHRDGCLGSFEGSSGIHKSLLQSSCKGEFILQHVILLTPFS